MASLASIVSHLDTLLGTAEVPDYPNALNGLQLDGGPEVRRVAAAVDFSSETVARAVEWNADLLLVHHGMFWGGLQPIRDLAYARLRMLIAARTAVYSSHLPLDRHPELGNNVLLARELGLTPSGGFARHGTIEIGVSGEADIETSSLVERASEFARAHGHAAVATPHASDRRTRRWGICTGAGASSATIGEALERGLDTLVVGEGPHHTAVEARDRGIVIVYAGHYATETLGVRALAAHVAERFGVDATFIGAPTGL